MTREMRMTWDAYHRVASVVRDQFGGEKALEYLVDTKLANLVRAASTDPDLARDLPEVVAEARRTFDPEELRAHLDAAEGDAGTLDRLRALLLL